MVNFNSHIHFILKLRCLLLRQLLSNIFSPQLCPWKTFNGSKTVSYTVLKLSWLSNKSVACVCTQQRVELCMHHKSMTILNQQQLNEVLLKAVLAWIAL